MTTTATPPSASDAVQTIRLAENLGPDISGRERGEAVRLSVDVAAGEVVFDCAGVDSMSPSFADEVFGKLAAEPQRPRIQIVNASRDILALVRFAVQQRNGA